MSRLNRKPIAIGCLLVFFASAGAHGSLAAESVGVAVRLDSDNGAATVRVTSVDRYKVKISVDPKTDANPLVIQFELPISGRNQWPVADVEVLDSEG
jgi:hypothetical protein